MLHLFFYSPSFIPLAEERVVEEGSGVEERADAG